MILAVVTSFSNLDRYVLETNFEYAKTNSQIVIKTNAKPNKSNKYNVLDRIQIQYHFNMKIPIRPRASTFVITP